MPLAQSADSEQAAWRKRIAIRPTETAQGRKQRRKGASKGARHGARAQAKPRQAQDGARAHARQGRKAQAMAQASQAKPSKPRASQWRTQGKKGRGARRTRKRRAIDGAPLIVLLTLREKSGNHSKQDTQNTQDNERNGTDEIRFFHPFPSNANERAELNSETLKRTRTPGAKLLIALSVVRENSPCGVQNVRPPSRNATAVSYETRISKSLFGKCATEEEFCPVGSTEKATF